MKWKVTWWIHGAGRICRGHDIIESEELDEEDAVNLIEEDLEHNLEAATITSFIPFLPNFFKIHQELMFEDKHSEISNWGVLNVIAVNRS